MATKARTITKMGCEGYTVEGGTVVPWRSGLRPELLSAWGLTKALLGAEALPKGAPIAFDVATLAGHLAHAHGGDVPAVPEEAPAVPEAEDSPAPAPAPVPVPVPSSATGSTGGALTDALAEFVATVNAASVDETKVRAIVAEVIASMPVPSAGVVVNVPERPDPVKIDGVVHERFERLVTAVHRGLAVYLFGPPATGKSHAAEAVAEALGLRFVGTLACSPDMMPTALRGFVDAGGTYRATAFRDAYEHGGVFVIDEIDNAPSAITVGLVNTVLASSSLVFPDRNVRKSPEFRLVVTANTYGTGPTAEFVGRFPLDPSTLSRFVRLAWDYSERVDRAVVASSGADARIVDGIMSAVTRMRANVAEHGLRAFVTSRDARAAALMLSAGWTWDDVCDTSLVPAGTSPDQRRQILANVRPVTV